VPACDNCRVGMLHASVSYGGASIPFQCSSRERWLDGDVYDQTYACRRAWTGWRARRLSDTRAVSLTHSSLALPLVAFSWGT
jgi:hypothetical protein